MGRELITKQLINTRLANNYGGWIYCANCNQNIGYLCYVTYDQFLLEYICSCGNKGKMELSFQNTDHKELQTKPLIVIKNRYCCPTEESPLFTILSKKLESYKVEVVCNKCHHKFIQKYQNEK